jgi:predicted glutamine amidotransferase
MWARRPVAAAELILEAENNLRSQACLDRWKEEHGDGWGIGWYPINTQSTDAHSVDVPTPEVLRSPGDARTDPEFEAAARSVVAPRFIAHVRQASVGQNSVENCHPFRYGPWLFAHNGTLTNFDKIGPVLEADIRQRRSDLLELRRGTTDSELLFLWLLAAVANDGKTLDQPASTVEILDRALVELLHRLDTLTSQYPPEEETKFNFFFTDGRHLAASRWKHDLHWIEQADRVVIASEPIGQHGDEVAWREVPEHSILTIDDELHIRSRLVS